MLNSIEVDSLLLFPGGYFDGTDALYYIADYQGNNIAVVDESGSVLERYGYYPYGEPWREATEQPFLYSDNERLLMDGLHEYDFHDRRYNPCVPAFSSWDKMLEQYPWLSPYCYCAANPVNAIDKNGNLTIFVNGYIGFGSPPAGEKYWNGKDSSFVLGASSFLKDDNRYFQAVVHKILSNASDRIANGYAYVKNNMMKFSEMLSKGEKINFVTHSMGAAYSKGMAKAFIESGINIDQIVHINPYQAGSITTVDSDNNKITTYDFQDTSDPVINKINRSPGDIKNADYKLRRTTKLPGNFYKKIKELYTVHSSPISEGQNFWKSISQSINK